MNSGRLGSGNNWACGYRNGSLAEESILNSLRWQLEHADRVDTILPILSLAGGTGTFNELLIFHLNQPFLKVLVWVHMQLNVSVMNYHVHFY